MSSAESGPPPGWPAPSEMNQDDTGPRMVAAAFATWSIALIVVLMRLWTRARIVYALSFSDLFIVLSLIAAGGYCVSIAIQCKYGMGKHFYNLADPSGFVPMMEAWWFSLLFYVLTLCLTKISICLLYLLIFTLEWARRACYAVLAITVITSLFGIAATLTYCVPLQSVWNPIVKSTFCQPQDVWWANTGMVIITDFLIFLLPIPIVFPLKLPHRQKAALTAIFAVGFFICLVSVIRLVILIQAKTSPDPDFTYSPNLTYWSVIEVHTAIVIACTMTLKPLIAKFFPNLLVSRQSSSSGEEGEMGGVGDGEGPPLTIGSRPFRPGGRGGVVGDVGENRGSERLGADVEKEAVVLSEKGTVDTSVTPAGSGGKIDIVMSPWMRGHGSSESAEDLGREMSARSVS